MLVPRNHRQTEQKKTAPWHLLFAVTCIDLAALSLINGTYNVLPGSIIQMLRGFKVICTAVLNKAVLGKNLKRYQLAGIALSCFGLVFAGSAGMVTIWGNGAANHPGLTVVALCVGMISQFMGSLQVVFEAKVMSQYTTPPLQLVGYEGVMGAPVGLSVIVLAYMLGYSNPVESFHKVTQSYYTAACLLMFLVAVTLFNLSGMFVTKYGSPVLRSMLEITRTAFIWGVEVVCAWNQFSAVQCGAFVFIALGTLLYGNFIKISVLQSPEPSKTQPLLEPVGECQNPK